MSDLVVQVLIGIISLVFGALIAYFFKSVSERKSLPEIVSQSIKEATQEINKQINESIKLHVKIHHQNDISTELAKAVKIWDEKLFERDIRLDEIRRGHSDDMKSVTESLTKLNEAVHRIDLTLVKFTSFCDRIANAEGINK